MDVWRNQLTPRSRIRRTAEKQVQLPLLQPPDAQARDFMTLPHPHRHRVITPSSTYGFRSVAKVSLVWLGEEGTRFRHFLDSSASIVDRHE
jgi:hypothetical protein